MKLKDMKVHTHLKPGQKGTKHLMTQYGDALVCVRYRKDLQRAVVLKTVELVVDEKPLRGLRRFLDGDIVSVVVAFGEKSLRDKLKNLGGRWHPTEKLWLIPYGAIRGVAELEERILESKSSV